MDEKEGDGEYEEPGPVEFGPVNKVRGKRVGEPPPPPPPPKVEAQDEE